ncbi:MAG: dipeptide epimerase [Chitinophagaceae bacterium]|nr:dipeptide epimerase [Chitinophagaceae bacterium]
MNVSYRINQPAFRYPFTISKGTKTHQPIFTVSLEWNGLKGYGEAPAIAYYDITVEQMAADLESKKAFVGKFALTDPERYWHYLHHLFPKNPFLVCALDIAAWDLYGKIRRKPLYSLFGIEHKKEILTDYTIGIDSEEKMVAKMNEKPWPIYKVKVGTEGDVERLAALRRHTDAILRVDANGGWTLEQALGKIPICRNLGVELVEQPLQKEDWEGMKTLHDQSVLPLLADESCVSEADVKKCAGHFHGINIKLTKCSGITPARRMIREARQLGLKIMLGCMNESTIGSAAMVHLSPLVDCDAPITGMIPPYAARWHVCGKETPKAPVK